MLSKVTTSQRLEASTALLERPSPPRANLATERVSWPTQKTTTFCWKKQNGLGRIGLKDADRARGGPSSFATVIWIRNRVATGHTVPRPASARESCTPMTSFRVVSARVVQARRSAGRLGRHPPGCGAFPSHSEPSPCCRTVFLPTPSPIFRPLADKCGATPKRGTAVVYRHLGRETRLLEKAPIRYWRCAEH